MTPTLQQLINVTTWKTELILEQENEEIEYTDYAFNSVGISNWMPFSASSSL